MGGIIAFLLFFLAGVGFGFAAPTKWRWLPLLFPLALGLWALLKYGPDAAVLLKLLLALIVTGAGILVGALIETRTSSQEEHPRYA